MDTLTTHLKALSLLLALVLVVAVYDRVDTAVATGAAESHLAAVWNPVSSFLGIGADDDTADTAADTNYASLQTQQTTSTVLQQNSSVSSLLNFGSPNVTAQNTPLTNRTPALLCVPDAVGANEPVIIMWACRDAAATTEGEGIDTDGATFGATRVYPTEETTYTVTCLNDVDGVDDTAASCTVELPTVAAELSSSASSVGSGETVDLAWTSAQATNCALTSDRHPTYRRTGISGEVVSPPLTQTTTFTLSCETVTGAVIEDEVTVQI